MLVKKLNRKNLTVHCVRMLSVRRGFSTDNREDLKQVSHTGQVFQPDDYRLARFMNAKRYVNKNFPAILGHMLTPTIVENRIICCEGYQPGSHPIFFINLDKPGIHWCYYCSRAFVRRNKTQDASDKK